MADHTMVLNRSEPVLLERITKGGRKLTYRIQVLQQPEKARACGSGPKSTTDRRPVDPPPVIELRIFEGADFPNNCTDITFQYNANFLLFCTLELARPLAHGRVQTPAATTPPVLSGMPASGMAYLDRPEEAGYFIFPDLSVRHEGRYKFAFNLYEEPKEDADMDLEPQMANDPWDGGAFSWRMEVKSADFDVFSAKKFPGLSESTDLSRCVAEQGCRVRIRRDVRMRRREAKPNKDFDKPEDEFPGRRTVTPDAHRARSLSNESHQRTPYGIDTQRRPSGVDFPPPPVPSAGYMHPYNGGPPSYPPTPYSAHHGGPQTPPMPQSPSYTHAPYPSQQTSYPPPPQPYGYAEKRPSQASYPPMPSPQRDSYPHDFRRMSGEVMPPTPTRYNDQELRPMPSQQQGMAPSRVSLPSLNFTGLPQTPMSASSPVQEFAPPNPLSNRVPKGQQQQLAAMGEPRGAKRSRAELTESGLDARLTNGARPAPTANGDDESGYMRASGVRCWVQSSSIRKLLNE